MGMKEAWREASVGGLQLFGRVRAGGCGAASAGRGGA